MLIKLTNFLLITPSYPFYCSGCGVISSQSHAMFKTLWTFDQCQNHLATWSQPPISWNKTILQYPTSNTRLKKKLSWAKGLATRDSKSLWSKGIIQAKIIFKTWKIIYLFIYYFSKLINSAGQLSFMNIFKMRSI